MISGLWLIGSPFVLGFSGKDAAMTTNVMIVGIIVATIGTIRAAVPDRATTLSWLNLTLGLWVIVSSLVLGTGEAASVNNLIVGVTIATFGGLSALASSPIWE